MTRQEALEAATLMIGRDFRNACLEAMVLATADLTEADLPASGEIVNWGKLAGIVLDKTGRTDLADAIWEGR